MNVSASGVQRAAKFAAIVPLVLALVIVVASRDTTLVHADSAKIVISDSSGSATQVISALLIDGDAPRTYYVWAKDINDPLGVGAYQVDASFNGWVMNVDSMTIPSPNWLFSSGRSGTCLENPPEITMNPQTLQGRAWFGCHTVGAPPPAGPMSNGIIASFAIEPGPFGLHQQTSVNFAAESFLKDTGEIIQVMGEDVVIDPQFIPSTISNLTVVVARCGDVHPAGAGDNLITISDVLTEATKFGKNQSSPDWNIIWDMNDDLYITIADILIVAQEFGRTCTIS